MNTSLIKKVLSPYFFVGLFVVVLLLIVLWPMLRTGGSQSVVYFSTGELYVGKLSFFPQLRLTDAYLLVTTKGGEDPSATNFQLAPLRDALWAPREVYLNRDQIIFYGPLDPQSKVAEALRSAQ